MNKKRIKLLAKILDEKIKGNKYGGTINLSGCVNRYVVGAKEITVCLYKYYESDSDYYVKNHIIKELEKNYIDNPKQIDYDSVGWWTITDDAGKEWLYIDLGFRFSDKFDAIKFAQFNGELAIFDMEEQRDIMTASINKLK